MLPIRLHFIIAWVLKISAGWLLGWLYLYYLNFGDTWVLFEDSLYLSHLARNHPVVFIDFAFNSNEYERFGEVFSHLSTPNYRAVLFAKTLALINLCTADSYWLTSAVCSTLAFIGLARFAGELQKTFGYGNAAAVALLYLPSVMFWSAGVLKESLAFGSLYWALSVFVEYWRKDFRGAAAWGKALLAAILLFFVWQIKFYYVAPIIAVLAAVVLARYRGKSLPNQLLIFAASLLGMLLAASMIHPLLRPNMFLVNLIENNQLTVRFSPDPNNLIHFKQLSATLPSLLQNLPTALVEGFTRPGVWEGGKLLKRLAALETFGINLLMSAAVWLTFKKRQTIQNQTILLLIAVCLLIVLMEILLTFASPNLGTLIRYRTVYLPMLVYICAAVIEHHWHKWKKEKTP